MLIPTARLALRLLPDPAALRLATQLAALPRRLPLSEHDHAALASAVHLRWRRGGSHAALVWGEGPPVLLVHGWGGRATQLAPLARHLAGLGFRAVAPDITGHGGSPGRRSFRHFIDDVAVLARELGEPLHALLGHSAGGMTMMAAREIHGLRAAHYVCLNAPRAPYPPVDSIRRLLQPRAGVLDGCRRHFAAQFGGEPQQLDGGYIHRYLGQGRLLLVYDEDDDQVAHTDAEVIAAGWPGAQILKTRGLGHQRVLWSDAVQLAVGDFLCSAESRPAAASP